MVGYWIAAAEGDGVIEELLRLLADAVSRGIRVTVILDERKRPDGLDNRAVITSSWPAGIPLPQLFTWHLPIVERHLKLHAKVIVIDRRDALITSANLTAHAMVRNIEMGIRITGTPARDVANHFDFLITQGIIQPYSEKTSAT